MQLIDQYSRLKNSDQLLCDLRKIYCNNMVCMLRCRMTNSYVNTEGLLKWTKMKKHFTCNSVATTHT